MDVTIERHLCLQQKHRLQSSIYYVIVLDQLLLLQLCLTVFDHQLFPLLLSPNLQLAKSYRNRLKKILDRFLEGLDYLGIQRNQFLNLLQLHHQ